MGALSGSISVRRYRVMERPPKDFRDKYEQAVRVHALVPLNPKKNPTEERALGWCSLHNEDDLDLTFEKFWLDGRVLLSLRLDVVKPPAGQVRRLLAQRQREAEDELGAKLSRSAVRDLKEHIIAELRKNTPPKVRTTDMVWNIEDQTLHFFSQAKGQNELFQDLFVQTFGIPLDTLGPGAWAEEIAAEEGLSEALGKAQPTVELLAGFPGLRPGVRDADELAR